MYHLYCEWQRLHVTTVQVPPTHIVIYPLSVTEPMLWTRAYSFSHLPSLVPKLPPYIINFLPVSSLTLPTFSPTSQPLISHLPFKLSPQWHQRRPTCSHLKFNSLSHIKGQKTVWKFIWEQVFVIDTSFNWYNCNVKSTKGTNPHLSRSAWCMVLKSKQWNNYCLGCRNIKK